MVVEDDGADDDGDGGAEVAREAKGRGSSRDVAFLRRKNVGVSILETEMREAMARKGCGCVGGNGADRSMHDGFFST